MKWIDKRLALWFAAGLVTVVGSSLAMGPGFIQVVSGPWMDGWCQVETQSFGGHCFSDFSMFFSADLSNPWLFPDVPHSHPPLSQFLLNPFVLLSRIEGFYYVALLTWLLFLVTSVVLSIRVLCKAFGLSRWGIYAALALVTMPVIMVLDRGNATGFTLILVSMVISSWKAGKDKSLIIWTALAISFRPQLFLLTLIPIIRGKGLLSIKAIGATALAYAMSFILYPGPFPPTLFSWLSNLSQYGMYANPFSYSTWNLGSGRTILYFLELPMNFLMGIQGDSSQDYFGQFTEFLRFANQNKTVFMGVLIAALTFLLAATYLLLFISKKQIAIRKVSDFEAFSGALLASVLLPGTSYGYYAVLFIPIALWMLKGPRPHPDLEGWHDMPAKKLLVFGLAMALIPSWLPFSLVRTSDSLHQLNLAQEFAGPLLFMWLIWMAMSKVSLRSPKLPQTINGGPK